MAWLGYSLLKEQKQTTFTSNNTNKNTSKNTKEKSDFITSFIAGFVLTLGDVKAIVFYVSLFPVFVDLSSIQSRDILVIVLVTIVSVAGVKILYAVLATKVTKFARKLNFENKARKTAGGLMFAVGAYLIVKA